MKSCPPYQLLRNQHWVRKLAHNFISSVQQLSAFPHVAHICDSLRRHLLTMPPHFLHCILSVEHSGSRYSRHTPIFPQQVAEAKHLFLRSKHVLTMIARKHRSTKERAHVVVLLHMDRFRIIRRKTKRFYPAFVHGLNRNFLSSLNNAGNHISVQSAGKAAESTRFSSMLCSLCLEYFSY